MANTAAQVSVKTGYSVQQGTRKLEFIAEESRENLPDLPERLALGEGEGEGEGRGVSLDCTANAGKASRRI